MRVTVDSEKCQGHNRCYALAPDVFDVVHGIGETGGALVDAVDFVTAITPEDLSLYRRRRCDKPMGVVTPGYCGRRIEKRRLSEDLPRRAVIVGDDDDAPLADGFDGGLGGIVRGHQYDVD